MAQVTRVMISVGSRPSVNERPPKGQCLGRFSGVESWGGEGRETKHKLPGKHRNPLPF